MARKEEVSQREREICFRLRTFRESTKIPRTTFALSIGISGERLTSYELGRVPVRYAVFKAINAQYRLRLGWLINGRGSPVAFQPLDDSKFQSQINGRERLSEIYDRFFAGVSDPDKEDAEAFLFAPGGLVERVEQLVQIIANPAERKKVPRYVLPHLAEQLERAAVEVRRAIERDLTPQEKLQRARSDRRERPTGK